MAALAFPPEQKVKRLLNDLFVKDPIRLEQTGITTLLKDYFGAVVLGERNPASLWAELERMASFPRPDETKTIAVYVQANGNRINLSYQSLAKAFLNLFPDLNSHNVNAFVSARSTRAFMNRVIDVPGASMAYRRRHSRRRSSRRHNW
jgi:hypothetical protein